MFFDTFTNIFILIIFRLWNIYWRQLFRKIKWQIQRETFAVRYNRKQGPVPARDPAVEKQCCNLPWVTSEAVTVVDGIQWWLLYCTHRQKGLWSIQANEWNELKSAWHWSTHSSFVNGPLAESDRTQFYEGLPSPWGSVDGEFDFPIRRRAPFRWFQQLYMNEWMNK